MKVKADWNEIKLKDVLFYCRNELKECWYLRWRNNVWYARDNLYNLNMRVNKLINGINKIFKTMASEENGYILQLYYESFTHQGKKHVKEVQKNMNIEIKSNSNLNFWDGCALKKI